MKSRIVYYAAVLVPLGLIFYALSLGILHDWSFILAISFYAFVYRTYVDYARIKAKNEHYNESPYSMLKPGSRLKNWKELV